MSDGILDKIFILGLEQNPKLVCDYLLYKNKALAERMRYINGNI